MNPGIQEMRDLAAKYTGINKDKIEAVVMVTYTEMSTAILSTTDPEYTIAVMMSGIETYADPSWVIHTDMKGEKTIVVHPKEAN